MDSRLKILQNEGRCFVDEPLSRHCFIGVGGKAKIFVQPKTLDQLVEIVEYCRQDGIKFLVVGNMSNIVFSDEGYNGVVVSTSLLEENFAVWNNVITCGAGTALAKLASFAASRGLSGLEWACGIPGTVGGAIVQNAGAFRKNMSDVIGNVLVLYERKLSRLDNANCEFDYRNSVFKHNKMLILDASFKLKSGNKQEILERMRVFSAKRIDSQPKGRSVGSVFKNPEGMFAGELLEKAGMKGKQKGGAMFSSKHANFIINFNNASFEDVVALIDEARERVYTLFGVWLEKEIELI